MPLSDVLEAYNKTVAAWLDQSKKETAAVQRLEKAVAAGNLRDLEKLRQAARGAAETTRQRAEACAQLEFDAAGYLAPGGGFLEELEQAAGAAGVRLVEREGTIFCYPVLVRTEPEMSAVRIDKKLEFSIRPEALVALLKRAQSREPKARPEQFIEVLFRAYELARQSRGLDAYVDLPLTRLYEILTLLPGTDRDYTLLDFTRDLYFLDSSGVTQTKKGFRLSLPASTVSRERSAKILRFVTREGYEKDYAAIKFTPPDRDGEEDDG